ncbi:MAG: hypothetical protein EHM18_09465 [Acidobacteria bacterium]|nr:MAG: hypothetical protein EHM18_09465 [Acidobacteriota bacterium]
MSSDLALDPGLAWFAVLVMGLLMLLQTVVIFTLFTTAGKQLRVIQPALSSFLSRVQAGTSSLRQLLSHAEGVPSKLAEVEGQTPELVASLTDVVKSLDQSVASFADRARSYLYQFDSAADTVLSNFSTQTFRVHRAVIHPAIRFSTLLKSINAVATRVFQDDEPPASHAPDQEIFI